MDAVEQSPVGLTLSDRRWPLIAAACGPTVARPASHVRFLPQLPTLRTGVHRRPPKHTRKRTNWDAKSGSLLISLAQVSADDEERLSGRFWLPDDPDRTVGGWLSLAGRWPALELAEPLTPALKEIARDEQPDGSVVTTYEPADDDVEPATTTIHGLLRKGPRRRVTLIETFNMGREQVFGTSVRDPGAERLEAAYALVGAHVDDAEARFMRAGVRYRHLDTWAQMSGIEMEVRTDGSETVVRSKRPDSLSTDLTTPAGQLLVEAELPMPKLTVRGTTLKRNVQFQFKSEAEGLTVQELFGTLVNPVGVLLSLALDIDTPPVSLEVQTPSGEWLCLVHPLVEADDVEPPRHVLLWREQLDLSMIGAWLCKANELSPVPQLVAGVAFGSSNRTLENQLLELATAAEGLHRRLFPNERLMSRSKAERTASDASYAVLGDVRQLVRKRLAHLEEPSYRDRLNKLIERAGDSAGMVGSPEEWVGRVLPARNGFAHRLTGGKGADMDEHLVLMRSLRWLLTTLLLLEAGVDPSLLQQRLGEHQPYLHFLRQARRWLPDVYREASG